MLSVIIYKKYKWSCRTESSFAFPWLEIWLDHEWSRQVMSAETQSMTCFAIFSAFVGLCLSGFSFFVCLSCRFSFLQRCHLHQEVLRTDSNTRTPVSTRISSCLTLFSSGKVGKKTILTSTCVMHPWAWCIWCNQFFITLSGAFQAFHLQDSRMFGDLGAAAHQHQLSRLQCQPAIKWIKCQNHPEPTSFRIAKNI